MHLLRDRQRSRSTGNQYGCALRFFFGTVLGFDGKQFHIPLGIAPQHLPEILSREEIARLFAAATRLHPGPAVRPNCPGWVVMLQAQPPSTQKRGPGDPPSTPTFFTQPIRATPSSACW